MKVSEDTSSKLIDVLNILSTGASLDVAICNVRTENKVTRFEVDGGFLGNIKFEIEGGSGDSHIDDTLKRLMALKSLLLIPVVHPPVKTE